MAKPLRVAFLLSTLMGGGLEKVVLNLAQGLVQHNVQLDLVLASAEGDFLSEVPPGVNVVDLQTPIDSRTRQAVKVIGPLVQYLRREKPDVLISHLASVNVVAIAARFLAGIPLHLALVEHNLVLPYGTSSQPLPLLMHLMRWFYPFADAIVGVSQGIADQFAADLGLKASKIQVIHNPVVNSHLSTQAQAPLNHPWFQPGEPPVLLAAGRLVTQKDFPTLLYAFAELLKQRPARLLILGEGPLRSRLETLIETLQLSEQVSMPGFASNPYSYMSRAAAFVLSSRWEGLPTVLIEALACGCNVVSTRCPHGPEEILQDGRYGRLVPIGDINALAEAMQQTLEAPLNPEMLSHRAQDFSLERATLAYLRLMGVDPQRPENTGSTLNATHSQAY